MINCFPSHLKRERNTQLEIPNKKSFWLKIIALFKGILGYASETPLESIFKAETCKICPFSKSDFMHRCNS